MSNTYSGYLGICLRDFRPCRYGLLVQTAHRYGTPCSLPMTLWLPLTHAPDSPRNRKWTKTAWKDLQPCHPSFSLALINIPFPLSTIALSSTCFWYRLLLDKSHTTINIYCRVGLLRWRHTLCIFHHRPPWGKLTCPTRHLTERPT